MKFCIILLCFLSLEVFAFKIEFNKIELEQQWDAKFLLSSSKHKAEGILDCQSFFNKLDFYSASGQLISENFVFPDECEEIYSRTIYCLENYGSQCFDSQNIFNNSCDCL